MLELDSVWHLSGGNLKPGLGLDLCSRKVRLQKLHSNLSGSFKRRSAEQIVLLEAEKYLSEMIGADSGLEGSAESV